MHTNVLRKFTFGLRSLCSWKDFFQLFNLININFMASLFWNQACYKSPSTSKGHEKFSCFILVYEVTGKLVLLMRCDSKSRFILFITMYSCNSEDQFAKQNYQLGLSPFLQMGTIIKPHFSWEKVWWRLKIKVLVNAYKM